MSDVIKIAAVKDSYGDEVMVKSHAAAIKVNDEYTLATKLVEVVQGINARAKKTDLKVAKDELSGEIDSLRDELSENINTTKNDLQTKITTLDDELHADIESLETSMNESISDSYSELSDSIAGIDAKLDAHLVEQEENFDAIHEELSGKVETSDYNATLEQLNAELALRAKSTDVTTEINAAIDGLINGAPDTYNTLQEIATYITEHEDVVESLNAAIGAKADKTEVEALQVIINALGALASKDVVTAADLDVELAGAIENIGDKADISTLDAVRSELERQINSAKSESEQSVARVETELTAAINAKADDATIQAALNGLGDMASKDTVSESDLDDALKAKIEAGASGGSNSGGSFTLSDGSDEDSWEPGNLVFVYRTEPKDDLTIE